MTPLISFSKLDPVDTLIHTDTQTIVQLWLLGHYISFHSFWGVCPKLQMETSPSMNLSLCWSFTQSDQHILCMLAYRHTLQKYNLRCTPVPHSSSLQIPQLWTDLWNQLLLQVSAQIPPEILPLLLLTHHPFIFFVVNQFYCLSFLCC